ncbi:MAG: hypothetical protein KME18_27860, partial [Phormidium tanganyikae FI6-MK23]|nr:hypothetical protein [Phormidium tanganyikae FI6-MK23]
RVHLVYYPPYHSKYNPIERCWAALENYWNATVLDSIQTALCWAANMTWKGCLRLSICCIRTTKKQSKSFLQN